MKTVPEHSVSDQAGASIHTDSASFLLSELLKPYSEGQPFDVQELISEHSYLKEMPSLMVDLAFEDYWRKRQQGNDVDTDRFVDQFPTIRDRLLHIIDVGDLINQSPEVFMRLLKPQWPAVPSELGPFSLVRQIGEGAFSRVYLAKDRSLAERAVTLKVTQHAVREAEALGRLQHPNIVSPLGLYDQLLPGLQVIAMPFCGRTTLADLIHSQIDVRSPEREADFDFQEFLNASNAEFVDFTEEHRPLPRMTFLQAAAWIGAQVAEGLSSAHSKGFLHCDIKPSNILLRQNGLPLILDFNLSVSSKQISCTGGTLTYIAPEQLRLLRAGGDTEQSPLSGAVDIFSLGVTLIELIQGTPPFGKITAGSNGQRPDHPLEHGTPAFRFAPAIRKRLGPIVAELLEACVLLDPASRPELKELSEHLARFAQPPRKPMTRTRRLALAVSLGGILLLTTGTAWTIITAPTAQERFQLGIDALVQDGASRAAVRHFSRLLAADPGREDARALRACGMLQREDWQFAAVEFRRLSKEQPENQELHSLLGYSLCRWGQQHEVASHEYERAYNAGIHRIDVLNNLAFCQIRTNRLTAAQDTLDQMREQSPNHPVLIFNDACVALKIARERKVTPHRQVADAILAHPELSKDLEALIVAGNVYLGAAKGSPEGLDRAFDCLNRAAALGLSSVDLENLTAVSLLKADSRYAALRERAGKNPKADRPESMVARLIPPPLGSRQYLVDLAASLPRQENGTIPVSVASNVP